MERYVFNYPLGLDLSKEHEIKIKINPHPNKNYAIMTVNLNGKDVINEAVLWPGATQIEVPVVLR